MPLPVPGQQVQIPIKPFALIRGVLVAIAGRRVEN